MIAALDVHYDDGRSLATSAAVVFDDWSADRPAAEYITIVQDVQPYVSGEFFRRRACWQSSRRWPSRSIA